MDSDCSDNNSSSRRSKVMEKYNLGYLIIIGILVVGLFGYVADGAYRDMALKSGTVLQPILGADENLSILGMY